MDWQSQLISTYLIVDDLWQKGLMESARRYSNNQQLKFTDPEVISIFLFATMRGCKGVKQIYNYCDAHLRDWFPELGLYESFCYRLNRISDSFILLLEKLVQQKEKSTTLSRNLVVDSLPVVMASPRRSKRARVASELADKGYCSSKDLFFYGVKVHILGTLRAGTMPLPSLIGMGQASSNDRFLFDQIVGEINNARIFADKAYGSAELDFKKELLQKQNLRLLTPRKKIKGQHSFAGKDTFSTLVSSTRQPIESLFNWLNEKSGLQSASKVRSSAGLIVHVFGKLSAALLLMTI